jgi:hypothetical protein
VATYAQEALGQRTPWLAGLSGWGYWFAWTPGIAVNLILAADYLAATILPGVNTLALSLAIGVALCSLNALGLRHLMRVATVLMVLAGFTLVALLAAPAVQPSLFSAVGVWPLRAPESANASTVELFIKWFFVATWSAYGAELAASIVSELVSRFREERAAGHDVAAPPGTTVLDVLPHGPTQGSTAKQLVRDFRAIDGPVRLQVRGPAAALVDFQTSVAGRLPWALAVLGLATLVLLFLMTGSVVVPVKATVMNILSLGASFGALVWIFQDGHLSGLLGFDPVGSIDIGGGTAAVVDGLVRETRQMIPIGLAAVAAGVAYILIRRQRAGETPPK